MIAIIDYGMGNLRSVSKAFELVGAEILVTSKAQDIRNASGIVLPGVGSFPQGMKHLNDLGLIDVLNDEVLGKKKPFLGICLGMQLCASHGEEYGFTQGLGWIDGRIIQFDLADKSLKIPHMGWDDIEIVANASLYTGVSLPATFYFVHSYHFILEDKQWVSAYCDFGSKFVASLSKENIHLVQFHPEKSQDKGLQILENFLEFCSLQV